METSNDIKARNSGDGAELMGAGSTTPEDLLAGRVAEWDESSALKEQLLRLQADFDNYRKRTIRDRDDMVRRAAESLLKDLLTVLDHLDMGIESARKHHVKSSVVDGFATVRTELAGILEKAGVVAIDATGAHFDPKLHESVSCVESDTHKDGEVLAQTRTGYRLGNYVLRPAQVVTARRPAAADDRPQPDSAPKVGLEAAGV